MRPKGAHATCTQAKMSALTLRPPKDKKKTGEAVKPPGGLEQIWPAMAAGALLLAATLFPRERQTATP